MFFYSYTLITGVAAPSSKKGESLMINNDVLIQKTVEITVAKLSNSTVHTNKDGGVAVADFMQEIYNKLAELSKNDFSN